MNTKALGIILQCVAAVYGILLLVQVAVMIGLTTGLYKPSGFALNFEAEAVLLPIPLWFLGDKLRDGNRSSKKIAVILLSTLIVVSTLFAITFASIVGVRSVSTMVWVIVLAFEFLLIFALASCIQELREKNMSNRTSLRTPEGSPPTS